MRIKPCGEVGGITMLESGAAHGSSRLALHIPLHREPPGSSKHWSAVLCFGVTGLALARAFKGGHPGTLCIKWGIGWITKDACRAVNVITALRVYSRNRGGLICRARQVLTLENIASC